MYNVIYLYLLWGLCIDYTITIKNYLLLRIFGSRRSMFGPDISKALALPFSLQKGRFSKTNKMRDIDFYPNILG